MQNLNVLYNKINQKERWTIDICKTIAPLTLEINQLKKEKDVFFSAFLSNS